MPNELGQRIDDLDSAMAAALLGGDMTAATALSNQRDQAMEEFRSRQAPGSLQSYYGSDPQTIPQEPPSRTYGLNSDNELYYTDENGDIVFPTPAATESVPFESASPETGPMTPPKMPSSRTPPEMPIGTAAGGNNTPPGIPAAGGPGSFTPSGGNFNGSVYMPPPRRRGLARLTGGIIDLASSGVGLVDEHIYGRVYRGTVGRLPGFRQLAPSRIDEWTTSPLRGTQELIFNPVLGRGRIDQAAENVFREGVGQLHSTGRETIADLRILFGQSGSKLTFSAWLDALGRTGNRIQGGFIDPTGAAQAVLIPQSLGGVPGLPNRPGQGPGGVAPARAR